jgi:hypothetical protein
MPVIENATKKSEKPGEVPENVLEITESPWNDAEDNATISKTDSVCKTV